MQYGVFLPVSIIPDGSDDHPPAFAGRRLRPDLVCRGDDRRDGEWALSIPRWVSTSSCSEHAPDIPLRVVIRGALPFALLIALAVVMLCLVPSISYWLPNLVMGPAT